MEGIEEGPALLLLSAVGTAMPRWPSATHFWSWLGGCPQPKSAGGKVLARRVRPGAPRGTVALRLAARTLPHSQSALGGRLSTEERASWHSQGHHGDGAHTGASGLEPGAPRPGVWPTGPRRVCRAVPCT